MLTFPAISCGVYGYPVVRAARVAMAAIRRSLYPELEALVIAAFDAEVERAFRSALEGSAPP